MSTIIFNVTDFRAMFPAFASTPTTMVLQLYFDNATLYISDQSGGCYCGSMTLAQRTQALYLMTAHLAAISALIAAGQAPGIMQSATVDKVSVALVPPPAANQWQYWLQSTPYGQQLLSLLQIIGVGGCYYGGRPELSAFRRLGNRY